MCLYFNVSFFTTLSGLLLKLSTEIRSFSCAILAQAFFRDTFKPSMVSCVLAQASASNIDQILKSRGFRSGKTEVTFPCSKNFENLLCTMLEFYWMFGKEHCLVGR